MTGINRRVWLVAMGLCLFALVGLTGCAPAVGDSCSVNSDCPTAAFCDTSSPGGYCTIQDCRPGECPAQSVCVRFDDRNSYCLQSCSSDEDCRSGYACRTEPDRPRYCYVAP
jgi:hypothetical protein